MKDEVTQGGGKSSRLSTPRLLLLAIALSLVLTAGVELAAAQRYRAQVCVVDGVKVGINPLTDRLDFGDLPKGAELTRFVTLRNDGPRSAYILVLSLGGIRELMKVDSSGFVLPASSEKRVSFNVRVPPSSPVREYNGLVLIFRLPHLGT